MEAQLQEKNLRRVVYATTSDMDLYVATTGDDVTGDGSVGSPYATITRALQDVPKEIRHIVHVHVAAGTYADFPEEVNFELIGSGAAFSIDGTAAISVVDAGPYTIDVGGVAALGGTSTSLITVAGGGLMPAAWQGKFLRMLTGAAAGHLVACADNTASVATVQHSWSMLAPGDTFEIVEPGVEFSVAHNVGLKLSSGTATPIRLLLGIKLTVQDLTVSSGLWSMAGTVLDYRYGYFKGDADVSGYAFTSLPLALLADVPGILTGWGGTWLCAAPPGTETTTLNDAAKITGVCMIRSLDLAYGSPMVGNVTIYHDAATYGIDAYILLGGANLSSVSVRVPATRDAIGIKNTGYAALDLIHVTQARYAVLVGVGANAVINELRGVDANVTNALYVSQGSRVSTKATGCTLVGASGAGNAIKWASGAANSAYPAANNVVTDALGAQVAGY